MPFFAGLDVLDSETFRFRWDSVVDLQGETTTAEIVVSDGACDVSPQTCFSEASIVARFPDQTGTSVVLTASQLGLPKGDYSVLIYGWDQNSNHQIEYGQFRPESLTIE